MKHNASDEPEAVEIDAALARLPAWDPPADFAARLAAAAARQAAEPALQPLPQWRWLPALTTGILTALGGLVLALLLMLVPWGSLTAHPAFAWIAVTGFMAAGLYFSHRIQRAD
jgi:hypothetical protein